MKILIEGLLVVGNGSLAWDMSEVSKWPRARIRLLFSVIPALIELGCEDVLSLRGRLRGGRFQASVQPRHTPESEADSASLRAITGALRTTIQDHGPITKEWVGSAAKRIHGQLKAQDTDLQGNRSNRG